MRGGGGAQAKRGAREGEDRECGECMEGPRGKGASKWEREVRGAGNGERDPL